MITWDRDQALTVNVLTDCIRQHDLSKERLALQLAYYSGRHAITTRARTAGLPNNRIVNAYPQYIATMTSGYLIGDPVQYVDRDQEDALAAVMDAYAMADVQSVDAEIALHQAVFGRGVELCYVDSNANPMTTAVDPQNTFVVYDDSAEGLPLFGVYRLIATMPDGSQYAKRIIMYTSDEEIIYSANSLGLPDQEIGRLRHNFGMVPVVEYWNNSVQTGDFEHVTSLIDAYDVLQSDRLNDKAQFANALLVLTGVAGFTAPVSGTDVRTAAQRLREDGTLTLPDVGARAEYLTKIMNEGDTDILRSALAQDIHKFSHVPDLSDANFAGNSSGVAMKYKLFGLEQLTKIKERWFREGLRWRMRLFANFLELKGNAKLDADNVQMIFKRSMPSNDAEIAQMIATLKGIVPDNLLLAEIPFIEDVDAAMDALAEQRKENIKAQAAAFGSFPPNDDEEDQDTQTDQEG